MDKKSKIYISGHQGFVGLHFLEKLESLGYTNLLTRSHSELDLTVQADVREFFRTEKPEYVFLFAAKVGGIKDTNQAPVEFILHNLQIQTNVINAAYQNDVKKLFFLASSCIYPKNVKQPIKEEYLLSSELEESSKSYAIAKIAGLSLCQSYNRQYGTKFLTLSPCNLYGPGSNTNPETAQVIGALITRFHRAKLDEEKFVKVWGTGKARRDFLYIEDLSDAIYYVAKHDLEYDFMNVGSGKDVSIAELSAMIKEVTGFKGEIQFDPSMPDGSPRSLLDVSRMSNLGWHAKVDLFEGLKKTYNWYQKNYAEASK